MHSAPVSVFVDVRRFRQEEAEKQVQQGCSVKSGELGLDIGPRGLRSRLTFGHTRLRYPACMRNSQGGCLTQKQ
jgi:hypothetical protein